MMILRPLACLPSPATSRSPSPPLSTFGGGRSPLIRRLPRRAGLVSFVTQGVPGRCRASSLSRFRCCAVAPSDDAGTTVDREASVGGGETSAVDVSAGEGLEAADLSMVVGSPSIPVRLGAIRMSVGDQAFFVLAFIACTTSVAFTSLVVALIPTLFAMRRTAISFAKLADTAREELPSTMAAIRLSGMEISDLTLELSDLSQEITDGLAKSAKAVQAAEAGIRKIGDLARLQTMSIIEERASLPDISLEPVVAGAARKTSHVVSRVKKTFLNIISGGEGSSESESTSDRMEN